MTLLDTLSRGKSVAWRLAAKANYRLDVAGPPTSNAVLMYHSVGGSAGNTDGSVVTAEAFRAHLRWLDERYEFVDLPAVLETGDRPQVALTFDDGYRSVERDALDALREFDAPATVFCIADRIGGTTERGVPYLRETDVETLLADGHVTLGNHTRTHPHLSALDPDDVHEEVVGSKEALEARFDRPVDRFCYPYGDYASNVVDVVRESHAYATADDGLIGPDPDPHLLPRVDASQPWPVVRWELTDLAERVRRTLGAR